MKIVTFLSYQTADKAVAGQLKKILADVEISAFLAHEDINVSEEWRQTILEKIEQANIFIALLSKSYFQSPWCIQESGIAAYRSKNMTVIPISLDGTIPPGFIANFQSVKVDQNNITILDLIPGFLKHNFAFGIGLITDLVKDSGTYRNAEKNFQLLLPHIPNMTDVQIQALLECAANNSQIHDASLCATQYLPPLLKSHGHLLDHITLSSLKTACARYAES